MNELKRKEKILVKELEDEMKKEEKILKGHESIENELKRLYNKRREIIAKQRFVDKEIKSNRKKMKILEELVEKYKEQKKKNINLPLVHICLLILYMVY